MYMAFLLILKQIGSKFGRSFTPAVILKFKEEDKLSVDDKLSKYFIAPLFDIESAPLLHLSKPTRIFKA
jgi:hypothetical protein